MEGIAHIGICYGVTLLKKKVFNIAKTRQSHMLSRSMRTTILKLLGNIKGGHMVASDAVFGVGTTVENLQGAIDGELFEVNQMYDVYLNAIIKRKRC